MEHDLSTLNLAALCALPRYDLAAHLTRAGVRRYHLQDEPGNGCAGDAPGFPTYFTRSVYTAAGNDPERGPTQVISHEGVHYVTQSSEDWGAGDTWETVRARHDALMARLYKPLPFEHLRVQAWVAATHQHLRHCYRDDEGVVAEPRDNGTVIWPVPDYKLRRFTDDPRFSEEWRASEKAAIAAHNADVRARTERVATMGNHCAVRSIRRVYPEYTLDVAQLARVEGAPRPGDWWERFASRPTPAECTPPKWLGAHRSTGWCQFCGSVDGVQP